MDPLLTPSNRFSMFPIIRNDIWMMYKKHLSTFWTAEEIDLSKDIIQWDNELTAQERHFISNVLAFFAGFDGIVNLNLTSHFINEVQLPECKAFYGFQIAMENIHNETYSLIIDSLVKDPLEKNNIFNALETFPAIAKMGKWAVEVCNSSKPFSLRVIAYIAVEYIMFSSAFASIFWLKKRGLMPGLTFSNELISRDETLHGDFGILIYNNLIEKSPESEVVELIDEVVQLCCEFTNEALKCDLIGMKSTDMNIYIKYVADRVLSDLNIDKIYKVANPFKGWMDLISITNKTNFFERKVSEYSKAHSSKDLRSLDRSDSTSSGPFVNAF